MPWHMDLKDGMAVEFLWVKVRTCDSFSTQDQSLPAVQQYSVIFAQTVSVF